MAAFKSFSAMVTEINKRTAFAIKDTCTELREKLQEMIDVDFYAQYTPKNYDRQRRIIDACIEEMLSDSIGSVKINKSLANYIDSSDFVFDNIANGIHGYPNIAITEGRFWQDFITYCDTNIYVIFKKNLKKYNVPTQ